jgi:photosystem II stability/assembly factor-like uncharacterized protein
VAAIGSAFAPNTDRGVYRTIDGGKTWEKVLYLSEKVGFSDFEFLPGNPEIVFATAWKAERKPWTIISGGPASEGGIFKSVDGGKNWTRIEKGLPTNLIGKIDLAMCPADSKVVYALVEAPGDEGGLYKSMDQGESFSLVSNNRGIRTRPFYYTNVKVDPTNPENVFVMATGYYKSTDGGVSWQRMRPPHGDNHDMWINPNNPDLFIQANDGGANVTFNGGKTWTTQYNQPTAELYQVEVDDQYPYWLYAGQQDNYSTIAVPSMAPSAIQDAPTGWIINTGGCETGPAVPKPGNHNIVYANCKGRFSVFDKRTGVEQQYDVGAANMYGHNPKDLKYRFQRVSPIHVSPHNPDVVYHTSQYVHKTTDDGKTWETISPDLTAFEPDKQVISGTPITRDITGEEFYSTIYAIRESPVQEGVIWVGANDGPVHVTRDGGANWEKVTPKMPSGGRVDAVEPSPHDAAKAYIAVLRYQLGDWKPYIFRTNDYGKNWELLTTGDNGIPADYPTRVVREDPDREGLLYAGTEFGLFVSFDDGSNWQPFQQNLPVTPITDIKIHRKDLAISTMGRGFWIMDNLTPLHQEAFLSLANEPILFKPRDSYRYQYPKVRSGVLPQPAAIFDYYLPQDVETPIRLDIINTEGDIINTFISGDKEAGEEMIEDMNLSTITYRWNDDLVTTQGMNRFRWDMNHAGPWHEQENRRYSGGPRAKPGRYTVRLTIEDQSFEQDFTLLTDPKVLASGVSEKAIYEQERVALMTRDLLSEARRLSSELDKEENDALSVVIEKLNTEEGTYMQPKLVDQINYLYRIVSNNDH